MKKERNEERKKERNKFISQKSTNESKQYKQTLHGDFQQVSWEAEVYWCWSPIWYMLVIFNFKRREKKQQVIYGQKHYNEKLHKF